MRKYVLHVENTTYRFFFLEKNIVWRKSYILFFMMEEETFYQKKKKKEVNLEVFYKRKYFYEGSIFKINK